MNKIKTLIISIIFSLFSISFGFTSEIVIGVIAAGIGDITNQNNEKLVTLSLIHI